MDSGSSRRQTWTVVGVMLATMGALVAIGGAQAREPAEGETADLRSLYSRASEEWPAAHWDDLVKDRAELGLVPEFKHPDDNPYSREKAELGRMLFWDGRLSGSLGVACVSCHHPDLGWSDGKALSQGHRLRSGSRNAPTLMGVAFVKDLMHDGRAASLESQVLLPLTNENELHAGYDKVEQRLNEIPEYRERFKQVFGVDQISLDEISKALACFQRTIVPGRSRFDAFLKGRHDALTDQEIRGLHLFRTTARCINCHSGPLMTDGKFHNIGLSYYGRKFEDLGRYEVTKDPGDVGAFRTPTLRNISRTDPYMHNGLFELDGVINVYNAGGVRPAPREEHLRDPLFPTTSGLLLELNLSKQDKADLIAFMNALEEPRLRIRPPELPADPE